MKGLSTDFIKKERPVINSKKSLKQVEIINWSKEVLSGNKKVKVKGY